MCIDRFHVTMQRLQQPAGLMTGASSYNIMACLCLSSHPSMLSDRMMSKDHASNPTEHVLHRREDMAGTNADGQHGMHTVCSRRALSPWHDPGPPESCAVHALSTFPFLLYHLADSCSMTGRTFADWRRRKLLPSYIVYHWLIQKANMGHASYESSPAALSSSTSQLEVRSSFATHLPAHPATLQASVHEQACKKPSLSKLNRAQQHHVGELEAGATGGDPQDGDIRCMHNTADMPHSQMDGFAQEISSRILRLPA